MRKKQVVLGGLAVLAMVLAVIMLHEGLRNWFVARASFQREEQGRYLYEWVNDLHSEDTATRVKAAGIIGNMLGDARSALPELIHTLGSDPEPQVRSNAAFSIQRISMEAQREGVRLVPSNPTLVPALIKALSDPEKWVRMNTAMALHNLGPDAKEAVPELIAGISREENSIAVGSFTWTIREEMMIALGGIGPDAKEAVPVLKKALQEELDNTRRTAARALGRIGPPAKDALKELKEAATDDENEGVRENAREAIKLIDPEVAKTLDTQ